MAKIRHIAIKVEDQEKTTDFYKKTFGMTEASATLKPPTLPTQSSPSATAIAPR